MVVFVGFWGGKVKILSLTIILFQVNPSIVVFVEGASVPSLIY